MQHETAIVKKVIKKYKLKDGVEKESISYKAKLDNDTGFNDGDIVALIPIKEINEISDIDTDEIQQLKNDVADKDETIAANNEMIDKLNAELQNKFNLIDDVTGKLKASEKTIIDLESNISEKDNIIAENDKTIIELSVKNDELLKRLNELTDLLNNKDKTIASLDESIVNYKIEIAEFNAIDVDKLKEKSNKLDLANEKLDAKSNVISLLQNQIMELQQLVNYKNTKIDRLENKRFTDYILKRDVTADVNLPTLFLIDDSGNLINEKSDIDVDATDVSDVSDDPDENDESGKDRIIKI